MADRRMIYRLPRFLALVLSVIHRYEVDTHIADGNEGQLQCDEPSFMFLESFITYQEIHVVSRTRVAMGTDRKAPCERVRNSRPP